MLKKKSIKKNQQKLLMIKCIFVLLFFSLFLF